MNTKECTTCFTAEETPRSEKIAAAVRYLNTQSKRDEGTLPADTKSLEACVRMVSDIEIVSGDAGLFKSIALYLKASPAFQSADYLEDYFDLDFESANPPLDIDYTGNYTFVPDDMLPVSFADERTCLLRLARFYFEHAGTIPRLKPNLEGAALPMLELSSVNVKEARLSESIFMGGVFNDCNFESVAMHDANLNDCTFTGCRFDRVNFSECHLEGASYKDCTFEGVSLRDTCFDNVTFQNCRFIEVELCAVDFGAADMGSCTFDKCWISHARMSQVTGLAQKQLDTFFGADSTILPTHLKRPHFWPGKSDITTWRRWIKTGDVIESTASMEYE